MNSPTVSICIPAYNRIVFLEKLLLNIRSQTYKDYEIIITDNSSDEQVKALVESKFHELPIRYKKNEPVVSMGENWNECLKLAKGKWIKFMHDDDFFTSLDSLERFVEATSSNADFIFSACYEFNNDTGQRYLRTYPANRISALRRHPALILAFNLIGNPSCTFYKNNLGEYFNHHMWMMLDIEYYVRVLKKCSYHHIAHPLVTIGFHAHQETNRLHRKPEVEIFEMLTVLTQGNEKIRHILVYDSYWRLVRNQEIRKIHQVEKYARGIPIPDFLKDIILFQSVLPKALLKVGIFSKMAMAISYFLYRLRYN